MTRPNCSLTRNHSTIDHPWPPCSGRHAAAVQPGLDRRPLDRGDRLLGQPAAALARPPPRAASAPARRTRGRAPGARAVRRSARWPAGAGIVVLMSLLGSSVVRRSRCAQPRAVAGGQRGAGPGQGQQQVVVVGDHRGRPRAGARDLGVAVDARSRRSAPPPRAGRTSQRRWPPRRTSRSIRARSRSTAAAGGRRPAASVATACGSSRSGSGVTDSQDARLTMGGRLTTTDHKVRMRPMDTAIQLRPPPPTSPSATGRRRHRARAAPVHRSGAARPRAGADLRAHLAARRPRRLAAAPRRLHHRAGGQSAGARGARRAARPARLPQRLPAPGLPAAQRLGPVQGGDPLPLSRLDLPARRHADRRPRGPLVRASAWTSRRSA